MTKRQSKDPLFWCGMALFWGAVIAAGILGAKMFALVWL